MLPGWWGEMFPLMFSSFGFWGCYKCSPQKCGIGQSEHGYRWPCPRCEKQQLAAHTMLKRNNAIDEWQFHYQWWTLFKERCWERRYGFNIGYPQIHWWIIIVPIEMAIFGRIMLFGHLFGPLIATDPDKASAASAAENGSPVVSSISPHVTEIWALSKVTVVEKGSALSVAPAISEWARANSR